MAKYFIEDSTLTGIASAIRTKTGTSGTMTPLQMPDKVADVYTAGYDAGETAGDSAGYTRGYTAGETAGKSEAVVTRAVKTGQYSVITAGYTVTMTTPGTYKICCCIERSNASTPTIYEPTVTKGGSGVTYTTSYSGSVKMVTATKTGTSSGTVSFTYAASSGSYRWIIIVVACGPASVTIA